MLHHGVFTRRISHDSWPPAVYEMPPLPSVQASDNTLVTRIGVVAADVASGLVLVGEFPDDEVRRAMIGAACDHRAGARWGPLVRAAPRPLLYCPA
jgi:hypothetical protein